MNKPTILSAMLLSAVAGAGVTKVVAPSAPPAPVAKLERICVEADGSAQIYIDADGRKKQLLVPVDHALAIMSREGAKITASVPSALSGALKSVIAEAAKVAK